MDGIEFGTGGRRWTHHSDSARGSDGAGAARALPEGVPEHLDECRDVAGVEGKQLQRIAIA